MRESSRRPAMALVGFTGLLVAAGGCQSVRSARATAYNSVRSLLTSTYDDPDAEAKYAEAEAEFERGNFAVAQAVCLDLAENTRNPPLLAEKARFLEAECLRSRHKYPDAAATYHRLLQDFPYGAYRERCCEQMYKIAYAWLETDTLKQIELEQAGRGTPWWENPPLPNLTDATKPLFDTEGEALRVLENVQAHDVIGPHADRSLFWLGYVHFYRGRYEEADHYFSQLVEFHKDSKLRPLALDLAIVSKNNATGGAVYDSTRASEALQLIHHAEATMPGYATDPEKSAELSRRKAEVRFQLAQKLIEQGKYYERANHPASAYFYYDLVTRQHPGTTSAAFAQERLKALESVRRELEAAPESPGPLGGLLDSKKWPGASRAAPTAGAVPMGVNQGPLGLPR